MDLGDELYEIDSYCRTKCPCFYDVDAPLSAFAFAYERLARFQPGSDVLLCKAPRLT